MDGTVCVGSDERFDGGTLYAVDASSGGQEWEFTEPSASVNSSPTVVDGIVYVGSADDTLYAVDASTGEEEWAFTEPSSNVFSSPTVVADPSDGDSIDSRVILGTLGHHDDLRAGEMLSMGELGEGILDDGTRSLGEGVVDNGIPLSLIAGGAVGALGLIYGGYRILSSDDETSGKTPARSLGSYIGKLSRGSDDETPNRTPEPTTTPETTAETSTTTDSVQRDKTDKKLREREYNKRNQYSMAPFWGVFYSILILPFVKMSAYFDRPLYSILFETWIVVPGLLLASIAAIYPYKEVNGAVERSLRLEVRGSALTLLLTAGYIWIFLLPEILYASTPVFILETVVIIIPITILAYNLFDRIRLVLSGIVERSVSSRIPETDKLREVLSNGAHRIVASLRFVFGGIVKRLVAFRGSETDELRERFEEGLEEDKKE